ncbi:S41 family peptidase [Mucilaginibacter ginsenosidivorax]|uniref:Tricorn protease homolog n=1 Tax=Mucilaginibacter ginsenosidivorax TaxID=862126 RepID=A0A5B8VZE6_9SPHI|nr:S41 family peptidase [Mucilaginibacter ginsenosidivorax]QEC76997.1 protease [Mucilaginibacter ginsenosidivorax]
MRTKLIALTVLTLSFSFAYSQQKGYYRTPCISKNTVVFTAEGDLWKYDLASSTSTRLTTNAGVEQNPAISPDGKQLAFTGQYEGVAEIYLMDINGGVPKRLTYDYDGRNEFISGWTKEGDILYRTTAISALPNPQMVKLNPATGKKQVIPLWQASLGCYDDNGVLYFTRFPNQGSKTKRYKGGLIEQVWKFDGRQEATNLTGDFDGTSTSPMYYNGRIYFLSDRDGTMNLWSMDTGGKNLKQQTFSKGWDLQTPGIYESKVVYQKGADIWLYDINTNQERILDINLTSDFDQRKPRWIKGPVNSISFSDISPNGNYVAIVSRGRVFVSPAKSDRWVEINPKSGIRAKDVHFINDKSIAVLSDQNGEFEVWKMSADGIDKPVQMTRKSTTTIALFKVSPNGKFVAYSDKNEVLRIADATTGEIKFTYDKTYGGIAELSWSPNSLLLNVTESIENTNMQISMVDTRTMKMKAVTTTRLNSYSPAWSADNNWLYFVSERNLYSKTRGPWGPRQPEPYYTQTAGIYAMPLDTGAKFPFLQTDSWLTDSVFTAMEKKKMEKKADKKSKSVVAPAKVYDWATAMQSVYQVPVKSGNITSVAIAGGFLYWLDSGPDGENDGGKIFALKIEESKKYEPTEVASFVRDFSVSANGKKILIQFTNKSLAVGDANGQKMELEKTKVDLANWSFSINPQEDWKEMFDDAWRMMRDYFYDRDMHKVKWTDVKKQYEPLLARVTDRYELDDLLGQMVGELSALHTFVYGGDKRTSVDKIPTGFLGATFSKVAAGVKIEHIYKADPDYAFSSPLDKPELKIKEGDIITAVNNIPLTGVNDIGEVLADKVGIPVKLNLLSRSKKLYEQVVKPFSANDAYNLRYDEWEYNTRQKVDSVSNNDIGYIHLKAMGGDDMDAFVKQFYPIFNRKGLILDVRQNFGGNIDSWVLEKLLRKAWMYWQGRAGGPTWNMQYAFRGHMVLLCDQQTASDGEAISEGFRRLGLGKVIGMRTWGGEIWLSSDNRMVDGGIASAAETGVFGPEGKWLIEGHGVDPDIVVDNLPNESFKGKDAQLEAALAYLKKQIADKPVEAPNVPQHPDKSFIYKQ